MLGVCGSWFKVIGSEQPSPDYLVRVIVLVTTPATNRGKVISAICVNRVIRVVCVVRVTRAIRVIRATRAIRVIRVICVNRVVHAIRVSV